MALSITHHVTLNWLQLMLQISVLSERMEVELSTLVTTCIIIPPLPSLWGVLFDRKDCYLNLCGAKNGEAAQNEDIITFPSKREFNFVNKIAQTMK